jgi:hypothetical protein
LIGLITFFSTIGGRLALGAGLIMALVALRAADIHKQRNIGATGAVEKIEKANEKATDLGKKAAAKSRAPVTGRVRAADRDPTTRDD